MREKCRACANDDPAFKIIAWETDMPCRTSASLRDHDSAALGFRRRIIPAGAGSEMGTVRAGFQEHGRVRQPADGGIACGAVRLAFERNEPGFGFLGRR